MEYWMCSCSETNTDFVEMECICSSCRRYYYRRLLLLSCHVSHTKLQFIFLMILRDSRYAPEYVFFVRSGYTHTGKYNWAHWVCIKFYLEL